MAEGAEQVVKGKVTITAAVDAGLYECLRRYWIEQRSMRSKENWSKVDAEKHQAVMRDIFGLTDEDFGMEIEEEVNRVAVLFMDDVAAQLFPPVKQSPAADLFEGAAP